MYTAVGAGILGIVGILLALVSLVFITRQTEKLKSSKKKVVFLTGCDSGLGFSFVQHAADMGFIVIAGFLSLESNGSKEIRNLYRGNIIQIELDITNTASVQAAVQTVENFLNRNPGYSLHALINNAAVMVFGEFEWLTEKLIREQVDVNLLGTFKITNAFCPLLRQHKGRIITISSHCSQANLPGLSVYGATKAALASWTNGIRVELKKYGVRVISFIPGSFVMQCNIMSKQLQNVQEMHDSFSTEQHKFYGDYFKRYNIYLSAITPPPRPKKIEDAKLYKVFECTLLDRYPKVLYKSETFRYAFYHLLFKYSPWCLRDYFVTRVMAMPEYIPLKEETIINERIEDIDLEPTS